MIILINFISNNFETMTLFVMSILVIGQFVYLFLSKPSSKRRDVILTWLLHAVIESERLFKSNTGQLKFSYVYNSFLKQFPIVSKFITREVFSELVTESLIQMKHLIETNKDVKKYIEGDK